MLYLFAFFHKIIVSNRANFVDLTSPPGIRLRHNRKLDTSLRRTRLDGITTPSKAPSCCDSLGSATKPRLRLAVGQDIWPVEHPFLEYKRPTTSCVSHSGVLVRPARPGPAS